MGSIIRFLDDQRTLTYVQLRENAVKLGIKLALAYPDRGVEVLGWSEINDDFTVRHYTCYPTQTEGVSCPSKTE